MYHSLVPVSGTPALATRALSWQAQRTAAPRSRALHSTPHQRRRSRATRVSAGVRSPSAAASSRPGLPAPRVRAAADFRLAYDRADPSANRGPTWATKQVSAVDLVAAGALWVLAATAAGFASIYGPPLLPVVRASHSQNSRCHRIADRVRGKAEARQRSSANPASVIAASVSRSVWQPPIIRDQRPSRSRCQRATPDRRDRTCS